MSSVASLVVPLVGLFLAAGGLLYGCVKVHPQSLIRWLVYAAVAVVAVEFVAMPVLPLFNLGMTITAQYVAIIGMMFGNEVIMEKILPWFL